LSAIVMGIISISTIIATDEKKYYKETTSLKWLPSTQVY